MPWIRWNGPRRSCSIRLSQMLLRATVKLKLRKRVHDRRSGSKRLHSVARRISFRNYARSQTGDTRRTAFNCFVVHVTCSIA